MAGYTRQATFTTGNVVSASDFTNEFDELLSAFSNTSGHAHDGTAAEGPVIGLIGDAGVATPLNKIVVDTSNDKIGVFVDVSGTTTEQVRFQDGAIVPVTDSDVDLGTSSLRFKDLHIDSVAMATTTVTDILDEDNMASNSATALATQQSIKAYVDANSGGGGGSSTFAGLTDTPSSLSSDGGKMVKVNSGGTALEFVTANTDAIAEGSSNQYHTTARARAAVSVASNPASGNGSLTYSDSTGIFTFTPADVSSGGGSGSVNWASLNTSSTTAPSASGNFSMALGYASTADGQGSTAIGYQSFAGKSPGSNVTIDNAVAVGYGAAATREAGVAIGRGANADENYSVAIGYSSDTSAPNQLMLGDGTSTYGFTSIRVGNSSYVPSNVMDLTTKSYVDGQITTNISSSFPFIASNGTATASGTDDIAIGPGANTNSNTNAIVIGKGAESNGDGAIAIGDTAQSSGGISIGPSTSGSGINIGGSSSGSGLSLGLGASSGLYGESASIGKYASATANNQLMLGRPSTGGFTSVRVGNTSYAPSNNLDLTPKNYVDTQVAAKAALTDLSVSTASASGGGALAYNSSTGAFTFTPSTSGNRTFVRYSRYNPSVTAPLTFNPSVSPFNIASTDAMFFVPQTPSKDGNSGTGITVTSGGSGVTAGLPNQSNIAALTSGYIELTNNSGSTINLTTAGQFAITARLTNRGTATGFAANLQFRVFETKSFGNPVSMGNIYPSGGSLSNTGSFILYNFTSASGTVTDTALNNNINWGNGQSLRLVLSTTVDNSGTLSGNATDYDFDIEVLDFTLMYDSAVSNYSNTTTDVEGIKVTFSAAGSSNYVGLNASPAAGDNVVGFYEGSSASSTGSDYDWSVYAPLPTSNLSNDDVIKYNTSSGWTYGKIVSPPTSFSSFDAGTLTHANASSFETVGTLMKLNDGHEGVGEVIVSVKTSAGVEVQKVNFLLTSSGVSHTTFATVSSTGSTLGTVDVVFSSANGGTALLKSQNASAVATTYTFHVTQL